LKGLGWLVEVTHGNKYMKGFPDLYLAHPRHGQRWVDVKVEDKYEYTDAQRDKWPMWHTFGVGIWIMTAGTHSQYRRLFNPPNWLDYWKSKYGDPFSTLDLEAILKTIDVEYDE
jgi:hypothetical protein